MQINLEPPPSSKRKGGWIQTFTGKAFYPLDPRSEDINIEDIAHALSMKCRYAGHCNRFFSVGQHSYYMSNYSTPEDALWALLHDASEAYLPDVPRPIKASLAGFKAIETVILRCIATRFELPWHSPHGFPTTVKDIDNRILLDEMEQLMTRPEFRLERGSEPPAWELGTEPLGIDIECWLAKKAEKWFLHRYHELCRRRDKLTEEV